MENVDFATYEFPTSKNGRVKKQTLNNGKDLLDYLFKLLKDNYIAKVELKDKSINIKFDDECYQVKVEE